jgi:hypothetical protein
MSTAAAFMLAILPVLDVLTKAAIATSRDRMCEQAQMPKYGTMHDLAFSIT